MRHHRCDELRLEDGSRRPHDDRCATYGTAQKMRASMTYVFGRICHLGNVPWQRHPLDGSMVGNPSVSEMVSRYMLSLHRRKVRAGEVATSARAITAVSPLLLLWKDVRLDTDLLVMAQDTLKSLYDFNLRSQNWDLKDYAPGTKEKAHTQWGGGRARRLLHLAYTVAFTCLLRVDEVLKIQSHDFILLGDNKLQLTLPFRKTSQYAGVSDLLMAVVLVD